MRKKLFVASAVIVFFALVVTASASHAPTNLTIVRNSAKTVTVGWTAMTGVTGYGLFVDGTRVATAGASATQAKFGTPQYRRYVLGVLALKTGGAMSTITVEPRWVSVDVDIPDEPPPSAPACSDNLDNDSDGKIDLADPGCSSATDNDETDSPPAPAGTANVWVDVNGGTCVRSPTGTVYNDPTACGSLAAAYTAAVSGDTVGVRDGVYPSQKFAGGYQSTQPAGTKTLLFKGTGGANFLQILFGSPNLTFDGVNTDARGTKTSGATFENGGEPFTFKNGAIGNVIDEKGALVTGAGIVFDNVFFHDAKIVTAGVHLECIWAGVPEGMVVRNSRFERCDVMDIFFVYPDYWNPLPPPYGNVTLENNWFGHPSPGYSLYIAKNGVSLSNQTPMSGWRVRNNYVEPGSYGVNNDQPVGANNIFCGNTGHANLPAGWTAPC